MNAFIRNTHTPLYIQVYESLKNEILEGELKQGERLPPEESLAKKFNISRVTLRKSIAMLIDEGLVFPQQGVGTFVSKVNISADYTKLSSLSDEVRAQGQEPGAQVLSIDEVDYDAEIHKSLGLEKTKKVICVKRIRTADNLPVAVQYSYFSKDIFQEFEIKDRDTDLQSLFLLMEKSGFILSKAVETISATLATKEHSKMLEIIPGASLLYITRISYSNRGDPLEMMRMYVRPDRYHCTIMLTR